MIPFLNSPLVTLQNKFVILQWAAGERSLYNHLIRGHSEEQPREAFEQAEILFSNTYEELLQQPAGTFHPGQPGRHKEQAELPPFFLESSFITHSTGRRPALARRPPQGP
jgi:hypothetical protein